MNNITKQLSENIYTRSDFYREAALLKEFLEHSFFSKSPAKPSKRALKAFLKAKEPDEFENNSYAILELGDEFFEQFGQDNFYDLFKESEKEMEMLPFVALYMPVSFSQKEIAMFGKWFRENVDENIFLDVKVDVDIVAGCTFVWKNMHHDMSFKKLLEEKKNEVVEIINRSVKQEA